MEIRVTDYTRRLKKKRDVDGGQTVRNLENKQGSVWKEERAKAFNAEQAEAANVKK